MTPADTESAEFMFLFSGLDGKYRWLLFEVMIALSKHRLTFKEVDTARRQIRAGADKSKTLEDLVQLSNERLVEGATLDE